MPSGPARRRTTIRLLAAVGLAAGAAVAGSLVAPAQGGAVDPRPQDRRGAATVEAQRAEPDPTLVPIARRPARRDVPEDRYAMAGGCYAARQAGAGWLVRAGESYAATGDSRAAAEPLHFQATTLGKYLLFDTREAFLTAGENALATQAEPGPAAVWTARRADAGRFRLTNDGRTLVVALRRAAGCADWPEVTTNISGRTFAGLSGFQEVRGTVDAHTHGMAFEFLGGAAHCGRPWSPYGVTVALRDCPDHELSNGQGAILESFLSGKPSHDPVGWPTFADWPAPRSLTHEGTYYKWMERAWKGGLRLFVNLLVENNQLCRIYPLKSQRVLTQNPTCDDMTSVRWQAQDMRAFERYIDAQYGGPGEGWYRIVTDPFEARRVINEGKLAVVMGIETSVPFGCTFTNLQQAGDVPACDSREIERQLDEVYAMGVRQMELVNKFDNALSGVAGDSGAIGPLVNGANFLETKSFWDMETCDPSYGEGVNDNEQPSVGGQAPDAIDPTQQDALFGAIGELFGDGVLPGSPAYVQSPPHCNQRALTNLGARMITGLASRGMVFDPDHMSVEARKDALDLVEDLGYSGVISSHSWSTPDAYRRILRTGGVLMPYAGDSTSFVEKWRATLAWADPRYYFGFGYGADINGLGAQGDPRGADAANPVTYPFTGWGGVTVKRQRSGERVYDINVDGVSHYGLYPDWLRDIANVAGEDGGDLTDDMQRGAEAYLQMWERATGVRNDACRQPSLARPVRAFTRLDTGASVRQVLLGVGQPHRRMDTTLTFCARRDGALTRVRLDFTERGRLARVRT